MSMAASNVTQIRKASSGNVWAAPIGKGCSKLWLRNMHPSPIAMVGSDPPRLGPPQGGLLASLPEGNGKPPHPSAQRQGRGNRSGVKHAPSPFRGEGGSILNFLNFLPCRRSYPFPRWHIATRALHK